MKEFGTNPDTYQSSCCAIYYKTCKLCPIKIPVRNRFEGVVVYVDDDNHDVEYEGETLVAADYRTNALPGLSIIISGDTAEQAIDAECDLLIHEATFLNSHSDIANEHLHSTAAGAARTAVECKAKHLAITHYSGRLENHEASLEESRAIHDSVVALSDGDRLVLGDDSSLTHLVKSTQGWTQQS